MSGSWSMRRFSSWSTRRAESCVQALRNSPSLELWSFYCPLPTPGASRHVVSNRIRRIPRRLDPAKVTVEQLPNAKMVVADYGC